jgi:hypothetical protein
MEAEADEFRMKRVHPLSSVRFPPPTAGIVGMAPMPGLWDVRCRLRGPQTYGWR